MNYISTIFSPMMRIHHHLHLFFFFKEIDDCVMMKTMKKTMSMFRFCYFTLHKNNNNNNNKDNHIIKYIR